MDRERFNSIVESHDFEFRIQTIDQTFSEISVMFSNKIAFKCIVPMKEANTITDAFSLYRVMLEKVKIWVDVAEQCGLHKEVQVPESLTNYPSAFGYYVFCYGAPHKKTSPGKSRDTIEYQLDDFEIIDHVSRQVIKKFGFEETTHLIELVSKIQSKEDK